MTVTQRIGGDGLGSAGLVGGRPERGEGPLGLGEALNQDHGEGEAVDRAPGAWINDRATRPRRLARAQPGSGRLDRGDPGRITRLHGYLPPGRVGLYLQLTTVGAGEVPGPRRNSER